MSSRVIAFVLSLVLAWAGLSTQEQAISLVAAHGEPASTEQVAGLTASVEPGSVEDHHLDDQPSQVHAEHVTDLTGLIDDFAGTRTAALSMARPILYSMADLHPPYLDGLQRPPCQARRIV